MSENSPAIPSYFFLLQRLKENDHEAFEEIYNIFWEDLYVYAYNVLNDQDACNDIIQDIFIDLWERRHETDIRNLAAYLHRAVRFQCLKHIRSGKIAKGYLQKMDQVRTTNQTEEIIHFEELHAILDGSIEQLPSKCKEIFQLSRFHHLSHQEIADKLGLSLQTVKNQVSKACQQLRSSVDNVISILLAVTVIL